VQTYTYKTRHIHRHTYKNTFIPTHIHNFILTYTYEYIRAHIYTCIHTYIYAGYRAKMADDVNEGIENALNVIVSTIGNSGNMKNVFKNSRFDTVNNRRKLYAKIIDTN